MLPLPNDAPLPDTGTAEPDLITSTLAGVARHLLTTGAGALVADGVIKDSDTQMVIGAGMAIAGIAWSWWQKRGQALALGELQKLTTLLKRKNQVLAEDNVELNIQKLGAGIAPSTSAGPVT